MELEGSYTEDEMNYEEEYEKMKGYKNAKNTRNQ